MNAMTALVLIRVFWVSSLLKDSRKQNCEAEIVQRDK